MVAIDQTVGSTSTETMATGRVEEQQPERDALQDVDQQGEHGAAGDRGASGPTRRCRRRRWRAADAATAAASTTTARPSAARALASTTRPRRGSRTKVTSPVRCDHSAVAAMMPMIGSSMASGRVAGRSRPRNDASSAGPQMTKPARMRAASRGHHDDHPAPGAGVDHLAQLGLQGARERDARAARERGHGRSSVAVPPTAGRRCCVGAHAASPSREVAAVRPRNISSRPSEPPERSSRSTTRSSAAILPTTPGSASTTRPEPVRVTGTSALLEEARRGGRRRWSGPSCRRG